MIIYSTRVWLKCGFEAAWAITAEWIAPKFRQEAAVLGFSADGAIQSGRMKGEWLVMPDPLTAMAACRLSHPDSMTDGRTWITDIGVRDAEHKPGLVECSVTIRTIDTSPMVASRPEISRPSIVKEWIERGDPAEQTPGWRITPLHRDNAPLFLAWIESPMRVQPILVLSPQFNGAMIVQPEEAWRTLAGLCDIVRIQHGHTDSVKAVLGERYAAWGGAGRIIYPAAYRDKQRFIPVDKLMEDDLLLMSAQEEGRPGRDLLERIAHRVNSANAWSQLVLETVREQRVIQHIRRQQEHTETAEILLAEAQQKEIQHERLKGELAERDQRIAELEEQLRRTQTAADQLRVSMDYLRANATGVDSILLELRPYFINAIEDDALLEEMLRLLEAFFPDRLVVLDSAYKSARKAADFQAHEAAFKLVLKLVTGYWERLVDGGGDARAREVFTDGEYAAREGEVTSSNQRAVAARTFVYKGEPVLMLRHLKYGVRDSIQDTLRVYFHWDETDRKIVIGHCGAHLPLR